MANQSGAALADRFVDGVYDEGLSDVLRGLLYIPRQLSHVWLYDERGCRLFEKICETPEYYVTRSETELMQTYAHTMAELLGPNVSLIEYGSGNSAKTRLLLNALRAPHSYVPIDIAASSLARAARAIQRDYPRLDVLPLCADFTRNPELPPQSIPARRVVFFPGSTLGNYDSTDAVRLLAGMRELVGPDGAALVGIDLRKDTQLLERAYNDVDGVTAEFNLNALRHVNRRLCLGFDVSRFKHRAIWQEAESRIEMHLVSSINQTIRMGAAVVRMLRGDFIRTEYSHKYTHESFARLAGLAGWRVREHWSDADGHLSMQLLENP